MCLELPSMLHQFFQVQENSQDFLALATRAGASLNQGKQIWEAFQQLPEPGYMLSFRRYVKAFGTGFDKQTKF